MTREEALTELKEIKEASDLWDCVEASKALRMAIEALSAEPSGDLISRADTVKMLLSFKQSRAESVSSYDMGFVDGLSHAINIIDLVPLVYIPSINIIDLAPSAEAVQGEWIRVGHDIYECSLCHQNVMTRDIDCYAYCHGCGAKMTKGGDTE